jgi:hypothetical protein
MAKTVVKIEEEIILPNLFAVIRGGIEDFNDLISEAAINMYNQQHDGDPLVGYAGDISYEMMRVENEGLVLKVACEVEVSE